MSATALGSVSDTSSADPLSPQDRYGRFLYRQQIISERYSIRNDCWFLRNLLRGLRLGVIPETDLVTCFLHDFYSLINNPPLLTVWKPCPACGAKAVVRYTRSKPRQAITCKTCGGVGGVQESYTPFLGIIRTDDFDSVILHPADLSPKTTSSEVLYDDFVVGVLPQPL